jgi:hypothetical protein
LGNYYKMDDRHIRTYIGQENPEDDSNGAKKSEITIMRDQSKWNTAYSVANREYTIMKKFTGRWYMHTGQTMPESTTSAELSSYAMEKNYEGGLTSVGEGKLNWRGRPRCGTGWAGISCYGVHSGSPQTNPNGGSGTSTFTSVVYACIGTRGGRSYLQLPAD